MAGADLVRGEGHWRKDSNLDGLRCTYYELDECMDNT